MQRDFLENFGVNVKFNSYEMGHTLDPESMEVILKHLYPNMEAGPASGYETEDDVIVPDINDFSWVENGVLVQFNQWE